MANATYDFAGDNAQYTTGLAVELNQPNWTLRYGFFQLPRDKDGPTAVRL